jgi:outer membrane scaffolding protein for murein synthesis (MipA/OmpV family)
MLRTSTSAIWLSIAGPLTLFASAAVAQDLQHHNGDHSDASRSPWRVTLGGGIGSRPEFPGSDSTELRPLPAFDITYADRWFFNRDGLGAYLVLDEQWQLSASVGFDLTRRDESDSARLRGLGDVDRTPIALVKGSYRIGLITTTLAIATDIGDNGHGTVADLAVQARSQVTPRLAFTYGVAARWANREYMQTFFGVDPQQYQRSALPLYSVQEGMSDARAFITASYAFSPHWIINTGAAVGQLQGDASDSPITEDENYMTWDAALLYRF